MKNLGLSIIAILILALLSAVMAMNQRLAYILIVILPYAAFVIFLAGFIYRVVKWWIAPVPFCIPSTCGQEKSFSWIKANPVDNPAGKSGVIIRMLMEIFLFRSLFRNTRMEMNQNRPVYGSAKWLWFFGLLFHWSFLLIILRHLRFFLEPVPALINALSSIDGFFEIGIPTLYLSDAAILVAASFLFLRRVLIQQWRYISLIADYFALLLILGIVITGLWMRHIQPLDLLQIKELTIGWATLSPAPPKVITTVFCIHLVFVFGLFLWFPFSKLMHAAGILFSPTRNQANNSRMVRHLNPWNHPVKVHSYDEYENEFRDKMKAARLPVEKE